MAVGYAAMTHSTVVSGWKNERGVARIVGVEWQPQFMLSQEPTRLVALRTNPN